LKVESVYGVDFSGAAQAGRNIWIARAIPFSDRAAVFNDGAQHHGLRLIELQSLESLCGCADRAESLAHLVSTITSSDRALWGMDFPFGLPIEVMDNGCTWNQQLRLLFNWKDDPRELGIWCLTRSQKSHGKMHLRRATDVEAKTPFDCYHYRIIYQTFFGMRDVLGKLARTRGTAILPFHYRRFATARRVVMEACPSSTLKRMKLPHQNYKQPAGGKLSGLRKRTRRRILEGIERFIEIDARQRRIIMRNGGGDALDAVIAAVGTWDAWNRCDHRAIARHPRYRREGYLYT
jgi:hypothetical protein